MAKQISKKKPSKLTTEHTETNQISNAEPSVSPPKSTWLPVIVVAIASGIISVLIATGFHYGVNRPSKTFSPLAPAGSAAKTPDYAELNVKTPNAPIKAFNIVMSNDRIESGGPFKASQGDRIVINLSSHDQGEADFQIDGLGTPVSTTIETNNHDQITFIVEKKGDFVIALNREEPWEGKVEHTQIGTLHVD
jgi:hypothetical protein